MNIEQLADKQLIERMSKRLQAGDPIEPDHYNKGEIDLYESWYLTRPFNEFRAILESIAERYMKRDKNNRLEDIDKCIYTLQRLREYEVRHEQETSEKKADEHGSQTHT